MLVISLFDFTGYAVEEFTKNGHTTIIIDTLHKSEVHSKATHAYNWDIPLNIEKIASLKPDLIFSFPPCTDLAASGARYWKDKAKKNPNFQKEAIEVCKSAFYIGQICNSPYFIENPVGKLSSGWKKYDFFFHPYEYGGYLSEDDIHPDYPKYIPARDAYKKQTNIWLGNGFIEPLKKPISYDIHTKTSYNLLGKSGIKTKIIRSATPRGFSKALYETYK